MLCAACASRVHTRNLLEFVPLSAGCPQVSLFVRNDVRRSEVNSRLIPRQLGKPWCLHLAFGTRWWWISLKLPTRSSAASGYRATPCAQTRPRFLCRDRKHTNTTHFTWILWINGWRKAIFWGESLTDTLSLKHFGAIWNCVYVWTAGLHGPNLRWVKQLCRNDFKWCIWIRFEIWFKWMHRNPDHQGRAWRVWWCEYRSCAVFICIRGTTVACFSPFENISVPAGTLGHNLTCIHICI